jgi:hypothetical protein
MLAARSGAPAQVATERCKEFGEQPVEEMLFVKVTRVLEKPKAWALSVSSHRRGVRSVIVAARAPLPEEPR